MNAAPPDGGPDTAFAVTLDNCAREPIHVPGAIQPHGVLLAFDRTLRLQAWSANADTVLAPVAPAFDLPLAALPLPEAVQDAGLRAADEPDDGTAPPQAIEWQRGVDLVHDVVVHAHFGRVLIEFERRQHPRDDVTQFALRAHRVVDQLRRQRGIDGLLQLAVRELRALCGFDRVMAYRFRHDDSGDIVAEDVCDDLEPFLGRRYPASDIPAQARRLYTLNTLRLIADAGYTPVPLVMRPGAPPLDLSHAVLRSVSPIHVEYLRNMGVGASMSVSIVVQDRLWGMLACHHRSPRWVPYSTRMACDVIAQVLGATVQGLQLRERAELGRRAAELNTVLVESLLHDDDAPRALFAHAQTLRRLLGADTLAVLQHGRTLIAGDVPEPIVAATASSLVDEPRDLVARHARDQWPADLQAAVGPWVGLLALRYDPASGGWLLLWRREQVETVRWGGRQDPLPVIAGPHGPRLTPRGSFDEWREVVRDSAVPWEPARLEIAQTLLAATLRASHVRQAEVERARMQMLAILGHDLRAPLHSITMAAQALDPAAPTDRLAQRIRSSSGRMQRLIGQILDLSRLRSGAGLGLRPAPLDVARLLADLVDESRVAHPGVDYHAELPATLIARVDPDRLAQVVSNLLSNARHHGEPGQPVRLRLDGNRTAATLTIEVRNVAAPLPQALQRTLFLPFKSAPAGDDVALQRNPTGLGLGLYIAHEIVGGHDGRLQYRHEPPEVVFTVQLPWREAGAVEALRATSSVAPEAAPPAAVLVVDDHRDSAESLCELLALEGYDALPAFDAASAQQLIGRQPWQAVVLDVQMPGTDGVALARDWRARLAPLPQLIALTGYRADPRLQGGGPFDLVLEKPLEPDTLLQALRTGRSRTAR